MLFMLALTGSMEMKGAENTTEIPSAWRGMTYNDDVRYSQWIINSRIADFRANSTPVGFGKFSATGTQEVAPIVTSKLDYVPGLVAKAIVENVKLNAAHSWVAPWYYSMKSFGDTYYNKVSSDGKAGKSQDDLNGIKMFFALEDLTASGAKYENSTTNGFCKEVMADARTGLNALNTNYIIGGPNSGLTEKKAQDLGMYGGWFHKYNSTASKSYTDQMWCDGLYMGPALLAQLINEYPSYTKINTNSGEDDWDLITRLFTISWNQLYDSNTGLLYHAFTANPGDTPSNDWEGISNAPGKEVYHSAAFWGRACGWYFLALVDILEQMDKADLSSSANYATLKGYLNSLAAGLANYQDAETGCWYQVLDEKENHLDGNYLESSCTAIFAAAYLKGTRLGYFTPDYSTVAKNAYKGCVNQFMMFDNNDEAQLIHCCASAGLGGSSNRSGSRSYYITGGDVTQRNTYTEGKVLGGFILAATEYERLYQAGKSILFSTDLKEEYNLEEGDEITIEACGADGATITYQWYKDGEPVEGATSATIVPTASGSYYCEATSGSTTVRTSVAQVTASNPSVKYTVTFYDGSQYGIQTIEEGKTVTAPAISPTKQGYTFKGWALANGSTARVLFPYPVYSDVNFYAVWSDAPIVGGGNFSATATATLNVPANTTSGQEITSAYADISGGKMYVYNGQTSDKDLIKTQGGVVAFQMPNNNTFFKVTLDNALMAGDKIKADIFGPKKKGSTTNPRGLWLTTATSRPDDTPAAVLSVTNSSTSDDAWMTSEEYTVKTGDGICGEKTFYIYRETGNGTFFTDFTVTTSSAPIGDEFTLDATTDYENFSAYVGEGKNVTFKRSFTANNWSTLVLPFSASAEQVTSAFGETCKIAKIKSMSVTGGKGEIRLTDVSEITANEPVLVMITPNAADEYVFEDVTVVAPTSVVSTSTDGKVEMHGVYETTSYTQISEDAYFLSGGKFYDWSYLNAMSPFSAYLLPVGENKPSSLSISMEETGIENVNANGNVNDNVNWNLAGQRVAEGYKGIKIVNGKKVF